MADLECAAPRNSSATCAGYSDVMWTFLGNIEDAEIRNFKNQNCEKLDGDDAQAEGDRMSAELESLQGRPMGF